MPILRLPAFAAVIALAFAACAEPPRRDPAQRAAFQRANPCPSTLSRRGPCPGYQVDHIVALCAGGADAPANMQWLSIARHRLKTTNDIRACRRR